MDHARFLLPFVAMSLLGAGCSSSTDVVVPPDAPVYTITPLAPTHPGVTLPAPVTSTLDSCLARTGAELVEIQSVNNNDTTAHGDIVTFAVSSDRRLAVA